MKTTLLAALFLLPSALMSPGAHAAEPVKSETTAKVCSLRMEEDLLQDTKYRFKHGECTRTDVISAKLNVLEAKLHCQLVSKADYCKKAPAFVDQQLQLVMEESRLGQRSIIDVIDAQHEVRSVQDFCQPVQPTK